MNAPILLLITEINQGVTMANKPKPQIIVNVQGGIIQSVWASENVNVEVFDNDNLETEGFSQSERNAMWDKKVEKKKLFGVY